MRKIASMFAVAMLAAIPFASDAGQDETQRMLAQRMTEAKQKLAAAESSKGTERNKMMQEHMTLMQSAMSQMQKAKPAAGMTPEQMREWIDEHLKLMNEMMGQMMSEHHMMMQSTGK